jgi:hypothetical protein
MPIIIRPQEGDQRPYHAMVIMWPPRKSSRVLRYPNRGRKSYLPWQCKLNYVMENMAIEEVEADRLSRTDNDTNESFEELRTAVPNFLAGEEEPN